ncbi:MAG: cell division protein FtsQ/DivIB [Acetobacteraceae bacterium]|nr:cell division protein FtsQ/DivIB [Acetobacteraceae bacterium]
MPGVTRAPRNSVHDRPGRLKLLLRRSRSVLRPVPFLCAGAVLLGGGAVLSYLSSSKGLSLQQRLGRATGPVGLRVTEIAIEGRRNLPESQLRAAIGVGRGEPILSISLASVRSRVESLSWVEHATVERRLPGTIVVYIEERRPVAIWQNGGKFAVVDRSGQIVSDRDITPFKTLPLIVGVGAPRAASSLLAALAAQPALQARVLAAVRVADRRWNLHLNSGTDVLLPEGAEAPAINRLATLQKEHALLDRPLQIVDMRLLDRLVVRPMPASAPASAPSPDSGKKPA